MFDRISHIGVVVEDMGQALGVWRDKLGFKQFAEASFEAEGIRSVFLSVSGNSGEMTIELMEPVDKTDMDNPVARRLAKAGEGFYHLLAQSLDPRGLQSLGFDDLDVLIGVDR